MTRPALDIVSEDSTQISATIDDPQDVHAISSGDVTVEHHDRLHRPRSHADVDMKEFGSRSSGERMTCQQPAAFDNAIDKMPRTRGAIGCDIQEDLLQIAQRRRSKLQFRHYCGG